MLFTGTGFFAGGQAFGFGMPWELPVILSYIFIAFGVVLTITVCLTYTVDCHRGHAPQAISILVMFKNIFAFGSTYYINDWVAGSGVRNVFFTLGGISIAMTLSAIPV